MGGAGIWAVLPNTGTASNLAALEICWRNAEKVTRTTVSRLGPAPQCRPFYLVQGAPHRGARVRERRDVGDAQRRPVDRRLGKAPRAAIRVERQAHGAVEHVNPSGSGTPRT